MLRRLMARARRFSFLNEAQPAQEHRIRRYLAAAGTSALALVLLALLWRQGYLAFAGLACSAGAIAFFVLLFYVLLRSGLNLRLEDPSLTAAQMASAIAVLCIAMFYATPVGRGAILLLVPLVFLFGVFRLPTRQLLAMAAFAVVGYAGVLAALAWWRPIAFNQRLGEVQWLVLAAVLLWFSLVGGHISALRKQLARANALLREELERSHELATRDELTGIHNRRSIAALLEQERARSERIRMPFCLCMMDIDHFKAVNDTYGHQAGDQVLRGLAGWIRECMRATDHFGRYGGEEFVVLLPQTALAGAALSAERLRAGIEQFRFPSPAPDIRLTASFGVAQYQAGEDADRLIRRADSALLEAKKAGRNRVALAPDAPAAAAEAGVPLHSLRTAG